MLIREPEFGYNTENKRVPRGGRARAFYYSGSYETGHGSGGKVLQQKREAKDELMIEETTKVTLHSEAWWVNLLNGFAEMTDPVSSDIALFLYCMLYFTNGRWKASMITKQLILQFKQQQ